MPSARLTGTQSFEISLVKSWPDRSQVNGRRSRLAPRAPTADPPELLAPRPQGPHRAPSHVPLPRLSAIRADDLSGVPRYLQVARIVEAEIRAGQWSPGQAVQSRNQLAQRFGIARETAARAHAWLAKAGYLVAVPGVGMVVAPAERWPQD